MSSPEFIVSHAARVISRFKSNQDLPSTRAMKLCKTNLTTEWYNTHQTCVRLTFAANAWKNGAYQIFKGQRDNNLELVIDGMSDLIRALYFETRACIYPILGGKEESYFRIQKTDVILAIGTVSAYVRDLEGENKDLLQAVWKIVSNILYSHMDMINDNSKNALVYLDRTLEILNSSLIQKIPVLEPINESGYIEKCPIIQKLPGDYNWIKSTVFMSFIEMLFMKNNLNIFVPVPNFDAILLHGRRSISINTSQMIPISCWNEVLYVMSFNRQFYEVIRVFEQIRDLLDEYDEFTPMMWYEYIWSRVCCGLTYGEFSSLCETAEKKYKSAKQVFEEVMSPSIPIILGILKRKRISHPLDDEIVQIPTDLPDSILSTFPLCHNCGVFSQGLLMCARCKYARYCSQACQAEHWKQRGHKLDCGKKVLLSP